MTCFVTRAGFRRRGISLALARAAVDYARDHGARAVEGYPMTTTKVVMDEMHVGTEGTFADAGFTEVSRPSPRRVVMRVSFDPGDRPEKRGQWFETAVTDTDGFSETKSRIRPDLVRQDQLQ